LLDSKRYSGGTRVEGDDLVSRGRRTSGGQFRAAAAALAEVLAQSLGKRPWVQALVVVWGDFPQRQCENDRVAYVHGGSLLQWLQAQPQTLSDAERAALTAAVRKLRDA
jgi:hypothetical protein